MDMEIREINKKVQQESLFVQDLKREIARVIVGQEDLIDRIMVGNPTSRRRMATMSGSVSGPGSKPTLASSFNAASRLAAFSSMGPHRCPSNESRASRPTKRTTSTKRSFIRTSTSSLRDRNRIHENGSGTMNRRASASR